MTLYGPWRPTDIGSLLDKLLGEMYDALGTSLWKKEPRYGQYMRATSRPLALSTAWTSASSFTSQNNFMFLIHNTHYFYWGGTKDAPQLGAAADISRPEQVNADLIVLNAPTIAQSSILGFGHNTGTREITFFHDLPIDLIESCNDKPISEYAIKTRDQLSFDEKIKYAKYLR